MKRIPFAERELPRPASTTRIFLVGTVLLALMTLVDLLK
jgi:hypothetical protein